MTDVWLLTLADEIFFFLCVFVEDVYSGTWNIFCSTLFVAIVFVYMKVPHTARSILTDSVFIDLYHLQTF